jgi:hypothetical protein
VLLAHLAAPALAQSDAEKVARGEGRIERCTAMRRDTDKRDASGQLRDAERQEARRAQLATSGSASRRATRKLKRLAAERGTSGAALQRDVLAAELRSAYVGGRKSNSSSCCRRRIPRPSADAGVLLISAAPGLEDRRDPGIVARSTRTHRRGRGREACGLGRKAGSCPWTRRTARSRALKR